MILQPLPRSLVHRCPRRHGRRIADPSCGKLFACFSENARVDMPMEFMQVAKIFFIRAGYLTNHKVGHRVNQISKLV